MKDIEVINNFIGYGDENPDIIFFGIEEHGGSDGSKSKEEWYEANESWYKKLENKYKKEKKPFVVDPGNFASASTSQIYQAYNLLCDTIYEETNSFDEGKIKVVTANFYPFWKKTTKSDDYEDWISYNFNINSRKEYVDGHFEKRKIILIDYFASLSNKIIFTFGDMSQYIDLINSTFKNILKPDKFVSSSNRGANVYYSGEWCTNKFFCCKHPSYNWISNEQLIELGCIVKNSLLK